MLLDERHAKELFAQAGIPVAPSLTVAPGETPRPEFPPPFMLKSQVLSGGRGKAGAIARVDSPDELAAASARLFALPVAGALPPCLLLEALVAARREYYVSFAVSRDRESLVLTSRASGGVEVESGGAGVSQNVRLPLGPSETQIRAAFFSLGADAALWPQFLSLIRALFTAVKSCGLLLAEINPLAETTDGRLIALDAKAEIDDSAAAIDQTLARYFEPGHYEARELAAKRSGFSYVRLPGFVGCLVNGAGLAMATMDALAFSGLAPANFLDLGGAASERRIREALSLLFDDAQVGAVFINLYGGILSCAEVAASLIAILGEAGAKKPVVARLAGNGAGEALALLRSRPVPGLHLSSDMFQALAILGSLPQLADRAEHGLRAEQGGPAQTPGAERALAALPALARRVTGLGRAPSPLDFGPDTAVLIQGATGKAARLHAGLMRAYGVNIAAGVTPFKGGGDADGTPIFNSVLEAASRMRLDVSLIFVPGAFAAEAILEAAEAGVPWIVCITEGIPQQDMLAVMPALRETGARLIGPNTPGIIRPGAFKAGIMPADPFSPGCVAVFSRSGTLTYEASSRLSAAGIGQALAVGVGGDPFIGLGFEDWLEIVRRDARVKAALILGEIGGRAEEDAAAFALATNYPKPVAAFVAGLTSPPGRRMGHAGAILEEGGGAGRKLTALAQAGIAVCPDLDCLPEVMAGLIC